MIRNPVHPGEIIKSDVLEPLGLTIGEAAERLGVTRVTLSRVVNGRAGISAEFAWRLEQAGVGTAETWMNLQASYELCQARKSAPKGVTKLAA
ncbi:MAG TPA: HigA family addiction module antitoxin [Dyella sp.]|uniref:HigA family addiction module antitoxin n=1 Tax=Dyella sp. TaxID=1869338 RepID=UPI002C26E70C|nr:HigA family addiction module antitoxin [Dyella sp.]HTV87075.1 HigA family addiction module antitoxin [Dyella sp.]